MKTIGFIGAGNMAFAMLSSVLEKLDDVKVIYTDISIERLEFVKAHCETDYVLSNRECVNGGDYLVLAVKPQYYESVLKEIDGCDLSKKTLISIAPGLTIDWIKKKLSQPVKVVRAMPNTPALVNEGMTGICFSADDFQEEERAFIESFFTAFGKMVVLTEAQLDMMVPISGSSPAYVYLFIEAMADAGVLFGLPRNIAYELAAQSVYGAAKMVLASGEHPAVLKDAVCSPGGTTIEAVRILEKEGFRSAVIEAMVACYDKTLKFK